VRSRPPRLVCTLAAIGSANPRARGPRRPRSPRSNTVSGANFFFFLRPLASLKRPGPEASKAAMAIATPHRNIASHLGRIYEGGRRLASRDGETREVAQLRRGMLAARAPVRLTERARRTLDALITDGIAALHRGPARRRGGRAPPAGGAVTTRLRNEPPIRHWTGLIDRSPAPPPPPPCLHAERRRR